MPATRTGASSVVVCILALAAVQVSIPLPAHAQRHDASTSETLAGRVTDTDGQPVDGARVTVPTLSRTVTTDESGRFSFGELPSGRHTLVVERAGYAPATLEAEAASGNALQVTLRATPLRIEGIVVTATRAPIEPLSSPVPTAAIEADRIRGETSLSLAHAIDGLAGVRTLSTGMQVGKPVIRGLTGARVLVLDDGNRLEEYAWSDEDGPSVDPRLSQRIEVIRGPASVLYGADALGGVVNVIPSPLPDALPGEGRFRMNGETYASSNNREVGLMMRAEGASTGLGWRASLAGRYGADLHTPEGELPNTGFGALTGDLAIGWHGSWGGATVRYARYGGEFKLLEAGSPAGGPEPSPGEEEGPERKLSDDRVQFHGRFLTGPVGLEVRAQWQRHWLAELAEGAEFGMPDAGEIEAFNLLKNTVSADVLAHHASGDALRGTIGVSAMFEDDAAGGMITLVPEAQRGLAGVFAFEQLQLSERWSLVAGARMDATRLDVAASNPLGVTGRTLDASALTGDFGLVFRAAEGIALSANLGRAWRAPTLFERFSYGPHVGEARFEIGAPDLDPETALDADVALRWQRGTFAGEVSTFRNRIDDYIHIRPTGEFRDGLRVYEYAQARAVLWGVEASAELAPVPSLTLHAAGDYVHGTDREADEPLPRIPPPAARFGAEWATDGPDWAQQVFLSAETEIVSAKMDVSPFDLATDRYTLLHLGAGVTLRPSSERPLRVDLRVRNATDAAYRDFMSRYKEFALAPGRNIVLRVSTGI